MTGEGIAAALEAMAEHIRRGGEAEYIATTPEHDAAWCTTAAEAHAVADEWLEPDGEWPPEIESTRWGIFVPLKVATMVDKRPDPQGQWDYLCDYVLRPAKPGGDA